MNLDKEMQKQTYTQEKYPDIVTTKTTTTTTTRQFGETGRKQRWRDVRYTRCLQAASGQKSGCRA